jgi:hypothetical protein
VNAFEMPSVSTAGSRASTNQSETSAAATPDAASRTTATRNESAPCFGSSTAGSLPPDRRYDQSHVA